MNTKILLPTLGALLLCSSTLALAGDWQDRGRSAPQYQSWHDGGWSRAERHWHEYRHYRGWEHDRSYPAYPRGYWTPAPAYRGYDRDGVTIILRGHVN